MPEEIEITDSELQKTLVRFIEAGMPIDRATYPESDTMRRLVRQRLLMLVGIDPEKPEVKKTSAPVVEPAAASTAEAAIAKEAIEPIAEPATPGKRTFDFPGSYGPDAPDVKKIAKAHKDGYPIAVYEFMQGMVDYGKGHEPPPRIWIEHKSGKKYSYKGNGEIVQAEDDPVTAIEFVNGGKGMPPEDIIINRHEGDEDTLGAYGKGLTLALSYIKTQGMVAKAGSYHDGKAWWGEVYLTPTESKVAEVLAIKGEWYDSEEGRTTRIRIENPTKIFVEEVSRSSDFFLYSNPRFTDAALVNIDSEAQAKTKKAIPIDRGKVICLDGIVSRKSDGSHDSIFIDGLRVPLQSKKKSILPWSIQGLGKPSNYYLRVCRSHNSMSYEAFEISTPVLLAVQQLENEELLRRLIKCAMKNLNTGYLEFMDTFRGPIDLPMSEKTAGIIRRIWEEEYGEGTLITTNEKLAKWYAKSSKKGGKAKLLPKGICEFLERAGVKSVESETAVVEVINFKGLSSLHVPSASSPNKFDKMMDYVAQVDGEAKLIESENEQKLQIMIPRIVKEIEEYNGDTEYSEGIVIRTVATIAHSEGLDYRIFAVNGAYVYEISMDIGMEDGNKYSTQIEIQVIEKDKKPEYEKFENGRTYIILSGDAILAFGDPAEKIADKKKRKEEKRAEMPQHDQEKEQFSQDLSKKTVTKTTIGQIKIITEEEANGEADKEEKYPNGYYQREAGSTFSYDEENSSGYWANEYGWVKEEVPVSVPANYHSAHVINDLQSREMHAVVPTGYRIAGVKKSPDAKFVIYRDKRTGQYLISGWAKRLVYYTCPEKMSAYDKIPPIPEEKEDLLAQERHLLLQEWRKFIEEINNNPALTTWNKVALAQEMWNGNFVYDNDYGLNDQVKGENKEEIAAKILNTSRGICNLSATGFAILLRSLGVPSRVCSGYWKQSSDHGGRHMWVEYWNGNRWIPHETEIGIHDVIEEGGESINEVLKRLRERVWKLSGRVAAAQEGAENLLKDVPVLVTRSGFQQRVMDKLKVFLKDQQ